jgi:hypothetical protein
MAIAGGTLDAVLFEFRADSLYEGRARRIAGDLVERDLDEALRRLEAGEKVNVEFRGSNVWKVRDAYEALHRES